MGKRCCVKTCRMESFGGCGVSFHGFPKNTDMYNKWLAAVPSKVTASSVVCSLHFKVDDYHQPTSRKRYLKADAVPSVFDLTSPPRRFRRPKTVSGGKNIVKIPKYINEYAKDDDNEIIYDNGDAEYVCFGDTEDDDNDDEFNLQDNNDYLGTQDTSTVDYVFRCKCCLGVDRLKSMWQGRRGREFLDYGTMLVECFALSWRKPEDLKDSPDRICESCVRRLTDAFKFKSEVLASEQLLKDLEESNEERDDENVQFDVTTEYLHYEYLEDNVDYEECDDGRARGDLDGDGCAVDDGSDDCDKFNVCEDNVKDDKSLASDTEVTVYSGNETTVIPRKRNKSTNVLKDMAVDDADSMDTSQDIKKFKVSNEDISSAIKLEDESFEIQTNEKIHEKTVGYLEDFLRYSNATPIGRHTVHGFQCCFCRDQYDSPKNLKYHTLDKHSEKVTVASDQDYVKLDITDLKCLDCKGNVDSLQDFVNHMKTEHRMRMQKRLHYPILPFKFDSADVMKCALCPKKFDKFDSLNKHMSIHVEDDDINLTKEEVGDSDEYEEKFKDIQDDFDDLKKLVNDEHVKVGLDDESEDVKFKCMTCSWAFENRTGLLVHMNKYHLKRPVKCQYCDSKFLKTKDLTRHMMVKHTGKIP